MLKRWNCTEKEAKLHFFKLNQLNISYSVQGYVDPNFEYKLGIKSHENDPN